MPIDLAALREKEKRDRAKLKAMVEYAYGRECRQKIILRYFGESDYVACGACDRCSSVRSKKIRPPTADELLLVRKALSGVARMCTRTKEGFLPRFGRNRVIQVLVGSHGKEVLDAGLNELTTYGLLKQKSPSYLHELFREMEEAELIYSTGGQYPMIGLADLGVAVMQNTASFDLVWPEERRSRKQKEVIRALENEVPFESDLYELLRKTRAALAQEQGGVPHYLVFPDETLKAFARLKPDSIESARRIRGVGEVKAVKYLGPFLSAIREYEIGKGEPKMPI
jgi:ATP-dependent DNA helicase RecQ